MKRKSPTLQSEQKLEMDHGRLWGWGYLFFAIGLSLALIFGIPAYMYSGLHWSGTDQASALGLTEEESQSDPKNGVMGSKEIELEK